MEIELTGKLFLNMYNFQKHYQLEATRGEDTIRFTSFRKPPEKGITHNLKITEVYEGGGLLRCVVEREGFKDRLVDTYSDFYFAGTFKNFLREDCFSGRVYSKKIKDK